MVDDDDFRPPAMSHGALFLRFLRFGCLAFGGPVAQIGMIRRELVERERWIAGDRFNRLLAVMQALPGPEAHELCVHLGMRAKGRAGGLLAGLGFMFPGFLLMTLTAWAYFRFEVDTGVLATALLGAQAAALALVARAAHRIGAHILTHRSLWLIGGLAGAATLAGAPFWIVLMTGAAIHGLVEADRREVALAVLAASAVLLVVLALSGPVGMKPGLPTSLQPAAATVAALFLTGLKGGLLTFGGAYTAIPFVRQDVVGRGWIDDGTFLDGVAFANILPAPLVIFATFAGYAAAGLGGAVAVTAGMFLPAFAFSLIFYDRLERIVSNPRVRAALDGVAAAVVGIIAATLVSLVIGLLGGSVQAWPLIAIGIVALVAAYGLRSRYAPPLILIAAGLAGFLLLSN